MRERERNLEFRRVRFHLFEKDPYLLIEIPCYGREFTRLNLKEIEKLNRFLDRAEMAIYNYHNRHTRKQPLSKIGAKLNRRTDQLVVACTERAQ